MSAALVVIAAFFKVVGGLAVACLIYWLGWSDATAYHEDMKNIDALSKWARIGAESAPEAKP